MTSDLHIIATRASKYVVIDTLAFMPPRRPPQTSLGFYVLVGNHSCLSRFATRNKEARYAELRETGHPSDPKYGLHPLCADRWSARNTQRVAYAQHFQGLKIDFFQWVFNMGSTGTHIKHQCLYISMDRKCSRSKVMVHTPHILRRWILWWQLQRATLLHCW